jgi:hypothetical protein
MLAFGTPKVSSNEKIFTPINSAINALATKKPAKIIKSLVLFVLMMDCIIQK